jgi:hypothetical protein
MVAERTPASSPRSGKSAWNPLVSILKPSQPVTSGYMANDFPVPGVSKTTSVELASPDMSSCASPCRMSLLLGLAAPSLSPSPVLPWEGVAHICGRG